MIETVFAHTALTETHAAIFRNIVSLRVSEDLFDDLSDQPADWQAAIALEMATKLPPAASAVPIIHRPFEEATWNDAIGYPFRHWMRSRYSDGSFGVWYGGDTLESTVHETVHHWRSGLLADAGFDAPGIRAERKVYTVQCDAALVDLRPALPHCPALVHPDDYSLTQQIGAKLAREGHPGLIAQSARGPGNVLAVLNPRVLSKPQTHCFLSYVTTADGVVVEREPGTPWLRF